MIQFKQVVIDECHILKVTKDSFFKAVVHLLAEDKDEYPKFFKSYTISELIVEQSKISYTKNFEIEDLFYFDGSSDFHFYSQVYVSALDNDKDKEFLCKYTLMLNERLEIVDDFLL